MIITAVEITHIRGLLAAKPPAPTDSCDSDCEHIECGFVVACEKYTAEKAKLAQLIAPLLDALEQSRSQEQQTAATLDGFLGDLEKAKTARVPLELKCPQCDMIHIDQDEWAHEVPHRTHLCHGCGNLWRPYPVGTVGVDVHAACRETLDAALAIGNHAGCREMLDAALELADPRRLTLTDGWTWELPDGLGGALKEHREALERIKTLEERRDELLALVARISQQIPLASEIEGWESQRAALIAEVGTLRARLADPDEKPLRRAATLLAERNAEINTLRARIVELESILP
jgi:hypothetical protein